MREVLRQRRQKLAEYMAGPAVLWAGSSPSRNFRANAYPFRASSHFLYFAGLAIEHAAIRLEDGRLTLFMDDPTPADILWHGLMPTRQQVAVEIGADDAFPLAALSEKAGDAATVGLVNEAERSHQSSILNRAIAPANQPQGIDLPLAQAIVELRLCHDEWALAELRAAIAITTEAHQAGMAATRKANHESDIRAAIEQVMLAHNVPPAYSSIVTIHGEVLHNSHYHHALQRGDLLLADAGAESSRSWASDVTRTWPISGKFSSTQRDIYEVVLTAHDRCIALAGPGVEYRDLHLAAAEAIAQGLVGLGILRGDPKELVDMDAHALFFPHGVGHLLGLDVHDMEDLGDLAGYETGRTRSDRFGLGYLRLDRPLRPGMVVTIEPGFYQVPALLNDPARCHTYQDIVDWDRLSQFADVRGIRIEDDVLITETGCEVLTAAIPTHPDKVQQWVQQ
ncbi:aminopeptidase P family protein [Leptolyngbya sp. AN02str]|uniref:aminopeptidase P family protein n=1 Tax=Leptolyngbya sp. AN02str TaxID=3423363 RepID=UPI003D31825D